MEKVIIIGCPGSGKSTFGRKLTNITGLPLTYLDMLFWNEDKTTVLKDVFLSRLKEVLGAPKWIIDGNYNGTMEMRILECDTVFFLDYPTEVCLSGIEKRKGQPRPDMPWVENGYDEEFTEFIKKYNDESRPEVMRLLEKYSSKNIIVFRSREESEEYLSNYVKCREKRCNMLGKVFILGDSYSTFEGYVPEGCNIYYNDEGPNYLRKDPELKQTENDVAAVEQTWWHTLINENGTLVKNCSSSGTTICNTGYGGNDCSKVSFVARFEKLVEEGYFDENPIDTIFLFGGTNDSWSDAPLGDAILSDWTRNDLYNVLPAFSYLINRMVSVLPDAKIYCIINTELKSEITDFYKKVCEKMNVDVIELKDIEKIYGHPTVKGMAQIKEQVLSRIKK